MGYVPTALRYPYRCVYCRRLYGDWKDLLIHEGQCDARYIVTRAWARTIAEAKLRERQRAK